MHTQQDLIFDIGMHRGHDTRFYLDKGFRVVALDANPGLCAAARQLFAADLAQGRLQIVDAALHARAGESVTFYINPRKDDWSSLNAGSARREGDEVQEVCAPGVTLAELLERHGVPRYIKCDIEGADEEFARQLNAWRGAMPAFVSIEAQSLEAISFLSGAGYDRFQLVNQWLLPSVVPPEPAREGRYAAARFDGHSSGLFGHELQPGGWVPLRRVIEHYFAFGDLSQATPPVAFGWIDVHATTQAELQRAA